MKLWQLVLAMLALVAAVTYGVTKIPKLLTPSELSTKCDTPSKDQLASALCDEMRQGR